ncbi:MAG TPA: VOC family protein [Myxococcota bacterium]|nr:VOC family protein [Myxococcota bacterium]
MPVSTQTFNHVAFSVPRELLDAKGRARVLRFYEEVFGWTEMPTLTRDGELLVLRAHSNEQFVFLAASEHPTRCEEMDHFGLSVRSKAEFDELLARAQRFASQDAEVLIDGPHSEDHYKVLALHSFYVRYALPLRVEVQCFEWAKGIGAQSLPGSEAPASP